jgi:regulatory protein
MAGRRRSRAGAGRSAKASEDVGDPQARARQLCLQLLTTRPRTRAELAAALARRGIELTVAQQVLARFGEVGLIDDAAFADAFVHSGHNYRGLGRGELAAQLRHRGVDERTATEAAAAVDAAAEEEMARALVRRRIAGGAGKDDQAGTIRKLVGMLARRGYPEGLSYRVVREEMRAAGQDVALLDEVPLD